MQINRPMSPILMKQLGISQTNQQNVSAPAVQTNPQGAQISSETSAILKNQALAHSSVNIQKPAQAQAVATIPSAQRLPGYQNSLKKMLVNSEANILAIIPRTFNAKDIDGNALIQGDEESGTFVNAVERLDEVKAMGINTFHILPFHPPGKTQAMGTAGSLYAPDDFLAIDPVLFDPNGEAKIKEMQKTGVAKIKDLSKYDLKTVEGQCKYFVDEAHARGISLMLDLPSCASVDFAQKHPELMAKEKNGNDKTPQGWRDIRMFRFWDDEANKVLNPHLLDLHKKYVDMCVDLGLDGIRADVARAKPLEFWNVIIPYSHSKDPEFGWLAETYTYEDASPQLNMPHDRPYDQLKAGFDAYYGQFHIFNQWTKANDLNNYMAENIEMSNASEEGPKTLLGSFSTHDDISPMFYGGAPWVMLTTGIQATLPMVNPYFVDGVQTGDYYLYPYDHAISPVSMTDNPECTVHKGRVDIFNLSRRPGGNFPEIGNFMAKTLELRNGPYKDVIQKGSFIPFETNNPEIIAYARHDKGKTLLVVANRNVNFRTSGKIDIPGFSKDQVLDNLVPPYGQESFFQKDDNELTVDLAPSRVQIFEINTPDIEKNSPKVYKQTFERTTKLPA